MQRLGHLFDLVTSVIPVIGTRQTYPLRNEELLASFLRHHLYRSPCDAVQRRLVAEHWPFLSGKPCI